MKGISDEQWKAVEVVLPQQKFDSGGRPRANNRKVFEGILWVLKNGEQWSHLPKRYGAYVTCWRRFREWEESGVWVRVWRAYFVHLDHREKLSWTVAFWDGSVVPTKAGAGS